jgi:TatD DNase family protein
MQLIDTHCHLAHGRLLPDVASVLSRARAAGVTAVICAAGDLVESRANLGLAHREKDVFALAGVHPHEAKEYVGDSTNASDEQRRNSEDHGHGARATDADKMSARHEGKMPSPHAGGAPATHWLRQLEELAADARNVGIGEIGLDYHYDFSPRDAQRRVFGEQLDLARRLGKNVVIHTREAFEDTLAIIAQSGIEGRRIVFHSFTENAAAARLALDLGAMISFSGIVTFARSDELRQTALLVPADRMLVETDAPYLSPEPVRKMKTNEPANVLHVAAFLARLRGVATEELASATTENAKQFFSLRGFEQL